jgi:hypothetical protein
MLNRRKASRSGLPLGSGSGFDPLPRACIAVARLALKSREPDKIGNLFLRPFYAKYINKANKPDALINGVFLFRG